MGQIGKYLLYRYGGTAYAVPLFNSTNDTLGDYMPFRVDGNFAYAQLLPYFGGYTPCHVYIRRGGTAYTLGFTGCPRVTEYNANPGFYGYINTSSEGQDSYTR